MRHYRATREMKDESLKCKNSSN